MKRFLLILALLSLPIFIWFFWQYSQTPETISSTLESFDKAGEETKKDLSRIPSLPVTEDENSFTMQDDDQTGLSITYANQTEENQLAPEKEEKDPLSLSFPKDQTKPIEIKLDKERTITIEDLKNQNGFSFQTVSNDVITDANTPNESFFQKLFKKTNQEEIQPTYLTATNQRKTLLYTFQKDHATNEKKLKSWTLYEKGNGIEEEAYRFTNAKIKINDDGNAEVFYFGEKEIQNQQTQADVEPSLLERAQRVISQDMGEDILNSNKNPDFLIPKPFFYDKNGDIHETDWKYDEETNTLSLQISTKDDLYPIALDPTLAFTAPAQSNTGWVVTGEGTSAFGYAMTAGDFNADGKTDLAVGAYFYSSQTGRAYIFYNDGSIPTTAATADIIITGETTSNSFGRFFASGDFNADGKTDLAVGAYSYSSSTGRAYIFYNGSIITENASGADVIITGEATSNNLGTSMTSGDFNADGKTDLAVGAYGYSTNTGRAYIFYNGSIITENASGADVIITGETTNNFLGTSFTSGDFNADGKTDLTVSAYGYSTSTGRAYIFYSGSIITENASGADVIITGETTSNYLGTSFSSGDFNADGKIDLAIGARGPASYAGRAYIFYNDGSIPTTAATADIIIQGEAANDNLGYSLVAGDFNVDGKTDFAVGASDYASSRGRVYIFTSQNGQVNTNVNLTGETTSNYFGYAMTSGDFNADGKTDLAVGANKYSTDTGRAYIFYNDGSIPTTAATADVIITGETTNNYFGASLTSGDFNADGKTDLAVGAYTYSTSTGRAYLFYNDGSIPTTAATADVIITGEALSSFSISLTSGDFNFDGKVDIAVGASDYSSSRGRAYIFYNDGSIPTTAATADVIISASGIDYVFGYSLASGDFNADGRADLAVGAYDFNASFGFVHIFYNDGSIPTTEVTSDIKITGESTSNFGTSLATGDFNSDGRTDLAVGAVAYSSGAGRSYLFYNDGSIPTTAATADVIITGEASSSFGSTLISSDFNSDGRVDFAVGATSYSSSTGRAYIFYNDGSIPTTAATADVVITGEATGNYFSTSLASGDFNADGKTDLVVGASRYSTNTGRVYLYETRDNFAWQLQSVPSLSGGLRINPNFSGQELKITGEVGAGLFGAALTAGDFNADGKTDLAVGAYAYSTNIGRVYIFYNDGHLAAAATSADVVISGETTSNNFGSSLTSGDFNADGKTDLAVGAYGYSSSTGRVYIFYNDGSIPIIAATADVIITGETTNNYFGQGLVAGDWNADGKTDLAVAKEIAPTGGAGRVYLFYGGSIVTENASGADILITGEASSFFGSSLTAGDFNADGKTDLAVGAYKYSTSTGRAYLFYSGSIITENASGADIIITGEALGNNFGISLTSGDWNADGKIDLAVGANQHSSGGRAYLFYNGSIITENASGADVIITGEASADKFGNFLTSGDFNADGKTDLAVAAYEYNAGGGFHPGRVYIFYNDGSIPNTAATADVTMTGPAGLSYPRFGTSLIPGDFNADGKIDLAVGAPDDLSSRGRVYMYTFNDGVITGAATNDQFGYALTSGDFNADGKTDLAVGAKGYSTNTGRVYIFYNDGSVPTTAATADVVITGETTNNYFGYSLASGDFNADGKTDLAAGAYGYSSNIGRAYLFYNDGSIPTTAATADVIITATNYDSFGISLTAGDLNADGKTDIIAGADGYSGGTGTGRAYIFYADGTNNFGTAACTGSAPTACSVGNADVIITGESSSQFGNPLTSGDFNADGKTDLVVGAFVYSTNIGRAYIFYNDGSIPTTAATADVIITGEASSNFGVSLTSGDFNADGKTDLAVGAFIYSTSTGRAYIFYNDGSIPTTAATADIIITGETTSSYFGRSLASGDWNADSKTDLAVGAYGYSSSIGRVYIFYNDGSIPTAAASADVITTGQTTSNYFGYSLASGDFNADGKTDLAVGAQGYSTNTGRAYIFITEAKVEESIQQLKSKGTFKAKGSYQVK